MDLPEKGMGAAADQQKPPADLTSIKKRNHGQFPADRVSEIIRYGGGIPGHGEGAKMAIWSKIFSGECGPAYSRRAVIEINAIWKACRSSLRKEMGSHQSPLFRKVAIAIENAPC